MSQPNSFGAVVVDANIFISICAVEPSHATAETALADYASKGFVFYAPNVAAPEFLYVLCQKLQSGLLTEAEYEKAILAFKRQMAAISTPPSGDASLIDRAKEIQSGYGCSRSADCLYIAFAEELAKSGVTELLTFDKGAVNQVTKHAPSVKVNLYPSNLTPCRPSEIFMLTHPRGSRAAQSRHSSSKSTLPNRATAI